MIALRAVYMRTGVMLIIVRLTAQTKALHLQAGVARVHSGGMDRQFIQMIVF